MPFATRASQWIVTYEDDFEGAAGIEPSPSLWTRDLGGGGFGNNELQVYTEGHSNAYLDGEGHLVIEAREETITDHNGFTGKYSSARLKTKGKFSQTYGRLEARIKLPEGQGIWPAFWMLGDSIDTLGWPECGEIDIMESIGPEAKTLYGTLHGPGYCGGENLGGFIQLDETLAGTFHVYGIEWQPEQISWFLDGKQFQTFRREDVGTRGWPFDQPFFLLLNLAVGGDWPGSPDSTTSFPQRLIVDYVRAYSCDGSAITEQAQ